MHAGSRRSWACYQDPSFMYGLRYRTPMIEYPRGATLARHRPRPPRRRRGAPSLRSQQHHESIVRSGPAAKRRCGTRSMLFAGAGGTAAGRLQILLGPRSARFCAKRSTVLHCTYTRATHYMYTVSVRAVLTIPHRPFMPICGEPATITAPISSSWHLVVVAGQVRAAIVRHRPRTAAPAHAKVPYSQSPILRIVLLHGS